MLYLYVNTAGVYIVSSRPDHNDLKQLSSEDLYREGVSFQASWLQHYSCRTRLFRMIKRGNKNKTGLALHVIDGDPIIDDFEIPSENILNVPLYVTPKNVKQLPIWKQKKNDKQDTIDSVSHILKKKLPTSSRLFKGTSQNNENVVSEKTSLGEPSTSKNNTTSGWDLDLSKYMKRSKLTETLLNL